MLRLFSLRLAGQSKLGGSCIGSILHCPVAGVATAQAQQRPIVTGPVSKRNRDPLSQGQEDPWPRVTSFLSDSLLDKDMQQEGTGPGQHVEPLGGAGECTGQGSLEEQLIEEQRARKGVFTEAYV